MTRTNSLREKITFAFALCILFAGQQTLAQQQGATIADLECVPYSGGCAYQQTCDPRLPRTDSNTGIVGKKCNDPRGVQGTCVAYKLCKAITATGSNGQSMSIGSIGQLLGSLGQLISSLKGQPSGGAAGGGFGGTSFGGPTGGCTNYTPVSNPTTNPCEYYVPQIGSSINIDAGTGSTGGTGTTGVPNPISDLINSLGGGSGSSNSNTSSNSNNASSSGIGSATGGAGGISSSTAGQATGVGADGARGDIRILPDGTTVVITNQNTPGNSVVAGFLGMQSGGGAQAQGIAADWCHSRPWATNFLSIIIPPVFFDSLCTLRGFQVGDAPTVPGGQTQVGSQTAIIHNPEPSNPIVPAQQNIPVVPASPVMQVDIWATPAVVPLGTRTTIFWSSKNAESCVETSPDGSFSHSTLSGGGATVPLSGATTFSISCTAPDGTHAADYVTVQLAI